MQGRLRAGVGLGEHRRRGGGEDLRTGEVRGLLGEVRVADGALGGAGVLSATPRLFTVEPIVNFWNAPSRPRSWLTCLMALSMTFWAVDEVVAGQRVGAAAAERAEEAVGVSPRLPVVTDAMPIEALSLSVTFEPSEKVAPPPVMSKVVVAPAVERRVEVELDVEVARAVADVQAVGLGGWRR